MAASVTVPVALSSMLLLPTLIRQLPASAKIAVLTYDSTTFGDDMLGERSDGEVESCGWRNRRQQILA